MSVTEILKQALKCDHEGRILEAQSLYQDGIQILMNMVGSDDIDPVKKQKYCERIKEYIDRAEQIQAYTNSNVSSGVSVTVVPIEEDSTGNSYNNLFAKYLDADVKELLLDEPYLMEKYQFQNLITFLELVVKRCTNIKYIRVLTKTSKSPESQKTVFDELRSDLATRNITIRYQFDEALHDRKIILSNGYIIKIGRGLNIFKPTNPYNSLGLYDYDFRRCLKTEMNVFHTRKFTL